MDMWDLIEAAADAWGEAPSSITIEVTLKSAAIRARGSSSPLFVKLAPDEPGRRLDAPGALRRAIALKFAERAVKLNAEAERSRRNADHWEAQARALADRAEQIDPSYHQWAPVLGADGEAKGFVVPAAAEGES